VRQTIFQVSISVLVVILHTPRTTQERSPSATALSCEVSKRFSVGLTANASITMSETGVCRTNVVALEIGVAISAGSHLSAGDARGGADRVRGSPPQTGERVTVETIEHSLDQPRSGMTGTRPTLRRGQRVHRIDPWLRRRRRPAHARAGSGQAVAGPAAVSKCRSANGTSPTGLRYHYMHLRRRRRIPVQRHLPHRSPRRIPHSDLRIRGARRTGQH